MLKGKDLQTISDELVKAMSENSMALTHNPPAKDTSRYTDKWNSELELTMSDGSTVKVNIGCYRYPSINEKARLIYDRSIIAFMAPLIEAGIDSILARKAAILKIGEFKPEPTSALGEIKSADGTVSL